MLRSPDASYNHGFLLALTSTIVQIQRLEDVPPLALTVLMNDSIFFVALIELSIVSDLIYNTWHRTYMIRVEGR